VREEWSNGVVECWSDGFDHIELHINKGTLYFFLMGRGDFSLPARSASAEAGRPDFGRLKPPLPEAVSAL